MSLEEEIGVLEYELRDRSNDKVLSQYYFPVVTSLGVINNALETLTHEGDGRDKEREQLQQAIEEQVTQSIQTISLWTKHAEESIREGNLSQWTNSEAFQKENEKILTAVDSIMRRTDTDKSGFMDTLRSTVKPVNQKIRLLMDIAVERSSKNLIRIEFDGHVSESVIDNLRTCPWEYQERVDKLPTLETFQTMESNIFWFVNNTEEQRCCATLHTGQPITFYVATKAVERVADTILRAAVLNDGKWIFTETNCADDYVVFRSEKVEAFFIVGTPRARDFIANPSGSQYIHRTDNRVQLSIPAGAVKERENLKITVFPVKIEEMKKRRTMFPDQYKFLSVTKGIHVQGKSFSRAVEVQLPLEKIEQDDETEQNWADMEYVYFHIDGDTVTQLKNQSIEKRGDTIVTNVKKFSTYLGARVRRGSLDSISSMEVLISLGFMYHCKLVTFVKKISEEYVQLWCELVKKEEWKRLEQTRLEEHSNLQKLKESDSKDIFIAERQRVRVDVSGNSMVGPEIPKNTLLITFFPIAEDNHIFPPLRKKGGVHGAPYSTITYSMDSGRKGTIHIVTFDPWTLPKTFRKGNRLSLPLPENDSTKNTPKNTDLQAKPKPTATALEKGSSTKQNNPHVKQSQKHQNTSKQSTENAKSSTRIKSPDTKSVTMGQNRPNLASSVEDGRARAQVAVQPMVQLVNASLDQIKDPEFYKTHFDEFLEDFGIAFAREKFQENGIDDVETFLMLEKEDMTSVLGLRLGDSLKCVKAKQKYLDLFKDAGSAH